MSAAVKKAEINLQQYSNKVPKRGPFHSELFSGPALFMSCQVNGKVQTFGCSL